MVQNVTKQIPKVKHNYVEKLVHVESQFAHDEAQKSSMSQSRGISAATFQAQCSSSNPTLPASMLSARDLQVQHSSAYMNRQVTNISFPHHQPLHTRNVTNQTCIPATSVLSFNSPMHQNNPTVYYQPTSRPSLPAQAPATTVATTINSLPSSQQSHHHQYVRDPPAIMTTQPVHTQHTVVHAMSTNSRTSDSAVAQMPPPNQSDNIRSLSALFESGI